jgi:hypothetical protein
MCLLRGLQCNLLHTAAAWLCQWRKSWRPHFEAAAVCTAGEAGYLKYFLVQVAALQCALQEFWTTRPYAVDEGTKTPPLLLALAKPRLLVETQLSFSSTCSWVCAWLLMATCQRVDVPQLMVSRGGCAIHNTHYLSDDCVELCVHACLPLLLKSLACLCAYRLSTHWQRPQLAATTSGRACQLTWRQALTP